jgi:hypothetical protein
MGGDLQGWLLLSLSAMPCSLDSRQLLSFSINLPTVAYTDNQNLQFGILDVGYNSVAAHPVLPKIT